MECQHKSSNFHLIEQLTSAIITTPIRNEIDDSVVTVACVLFSCFGFHLITEIKWNISASMLKIYETFSFDILYLPISNIGAKLMIRLIRILMLLFRCNNLKAFEHSLQHPGSATSYRIFHRVQHTELPTSTNSCHFIAGHFKVNVFFCRYSCTTTFLLAIYCIH